MSIRAALVTRPSPASVIEWRQHVQKSYPAYTYYMGQFQKERATALNMHNPKKTSWLVRKFYAATTLASHVRAFKQSKAKADGILSAVYQKTIDTFDPILEASPDVLLKSGIDIADAKQTLVQADKKHAKYDEALGQVNTLRASIETALSQCDNATTMEWFDLASDNAGINLLSYLETEEAKEAIDAVTKAIGVFKEYAEANPDLFPKNSKNPENPGIDTDNLYVLTDLAFDGGFLGAIFSYMNIEQLNEASEKLGTVLKAVTGLRQKVHEHHTQTSDEYNAAVKALNKKRLQGIRRLAPRLGLDKDDVQSATSLLQREPTGIRRARQNALVQT